MESQHYSPRLKYKLRRVNRSIKRENSCNSIIIHEHEPVTVGRVVSDDVQVRLLSKTTPLMISRKHATISIVDGKILVIDHDVSPKVYKNAKR